MRVNVYAEEMTDRVEIIEKGGFTGLRIFLALPASFVPDPQPPDSGDHMRPARVEDTAQATHYQAPFIHRPGDDDSSAVTFWGKRDLRSVLREALALLDAHYEKREQKEKIVKHHDEPQYSHDHHPLGFRVGHDDDRPMGCGHTW